MKTGSSISGWCRRKRRAESADFKGANWGRGQQNVPEGRRRAPNLGKVTSVRNRDWGTISITRHTTKPPPRHTRKPKKKKTQTPSTHKEEGKGRARKSRSVDWKRRATGKEKKKKKKFISTGDVTTGLCGPNFAIKKSLGKNKKEGKEWR